MALKENIEAIKKEIGTEEQFLEGIIKSERFFKKYKKYIISIAIVAVLGGVTYATTSILNENRLQAANEAYNKLIKDPNDIEAQSVLKDKNERLYNFYRFKMALISNDITVLEELSKYNTDPVISDLAGYQLSSLNSKSDTKSKLLSNFIILQNGFNLLKEDKIEAAKLKFAQISLSSPLKKVSNNLEHYQAIKLKGNNK